MTISIVDRIVADEEDDLPAPVSTGCGAGCGTGMGLSGGGAGCGTRVGFTVTAGCGRASAAVALGSSAGGDLAASDGLGVGVWSPQTWSIKSLMKLCCVPPVGGVLPYVFKTFRKSSIQRDSQCNTFLIFSMR
eukprot:CAMPEP_0169413692 /NCGR_PEP_ID=MMETSP1017-20121227/61490_1 /TAXON_ID=342587 /ORGANISM="Karlodinium micrum, Strain CCMP2283" /LENGTH=132 /DNA_ID=CAMNT_0009521121 /DNA_START=557 /DNA_END=955 /DNA_ORIENTATION=+